MAMTKEEKRLDDRGLNAADYILHAHITKKLKLSSYEKASLTKDLIAWHKSWSKLVNASQSRFNRMRRLECANEYGDCQCICTGNFHRFDEIDAGHFMSATKQATRFDRMNVHPQSKHSNNHKLGDDDKIFYSMWMHKTYGWDKTAKLIEKSKGSYCWKEHKEELLALRIVWSRNVKDHEERLGIR